MKKVAIIGSVGVPAKYGGFETLVENIIGDNCSKDTQYTVYCSSKAYSQKLDVYKGAKLKYIPLNANGVQSIIYDMISVLHAIRRSDVLLILGVSGCIILPLVRLFSRKKIIVNIDGLEHRRDKWSSNVRKFLKFSEKTAVSNADIVVADNKAIQDYIRNEYGNDSALIAYGGDHVQCDTAHIEAETLNNYGLKKGQYSFSLCRIEPENNVHIILEAYAESGHKLVFVGNWNNSEYGKELLDRYSNYRNISMIQPIYDLPTLNVLRANCNIYLHGHSAGGTNPSLVEAMFFAKPIMAFDCIYNRETTEYKSHYFSKAKDIIIFTDNFMNRLSLDLSGDKMLEIANRRYTWKIIAKQYEELYN